MESLKSFVLVFQIRFVSALFHSLLAEVHFWTRNWSPNAANLVVVVVVVVVVRGRRCLKKP